MRLDSEGKAIYEATLLFTPDEAREMVRLLNQLLESVPSAEPVGHNQLFDDQRELIVVVYGDPTVEQKHDAEFGTQANEG